MNNELKPCPICGSAVKLTEIRITPCNDGKRTRLVISKTSHESYYYYVYQIKHLIIPETVGQYIGLTDKNGKKIFEGDIVDAVYKINYVGVPDIPFGIGVVKFGSSYYSGASYEIDIIGENFSRVFSASLDGGVEIIGNVHDNPELLVVCTQTSLLDVMQEAGTNNG